MKTAFVFPGQGSQYVGMGQDLISEYPEARAVFDQAAIVLGEPFKALLAKGPESVLTDTINAQPAILAHSVAAWKVLKQVAPGKEPLFVAGHSLGEYSALVAGGSLELGDALLLVRERGRVMKSAGEVMPGAMAAVLGLEEGVLQRICEETGAQIANYNAPGQIVISGPKVKVQSAAELAKVQGAKRVIPLAVSIASHSVCMEAAAREFKEAVTQVRLQPPAVPVISNVTARPLLGVDEIRAEMVQQLTSSVQWIRTIEYMVQQGVATFVELGPKDVVAGLIRRINKEVHAVSIGDLASVKAFASSLNQGD